MKEGRWKQRCGDLNQSGHDWYGALDGTLQSDPELVNLSYQFAGRATVCKKRRIIFLYVGSEP